MKGYKFWPENDVDIDWKCVNFNRKISYKNSVEEHRIVWWLESNSLKIKFLLEKGSLTKKPKTSLVIIILYYEW